MVKPKAKLKPHYQVQYRIGTYWNSLSTFSTRKEAEGYAKQSPTCRQGYKIVIVHRASASGERI